MNLKSFLLYFLYSIAVFLFFLVILFPGHKASDFLSHSIGRFVKSHGIENILFENISLVFPPGLKFNNPVISLKNQEKIFFDSISIYPDLLTFFSTRSRADFKIQGYRGHLRGNFTGNLRNVFSDAAFQWTFSGLDFQDISCRGRDYDLKLSFKAGGNCEFKKSGMGDVFGKGKGTISLHDLSVASDNPFFEKMGIPLLNFNIVDIQYIHGGDDLHILNLSGTGPQFKITLNGHITLKKQISTSILELKGKLLPDPSFLSNFAGISSVSFLFSNLRNAGLPFKIKGTLESPSARL